MARRAEDLAPVIQTVCSPPILDQASWIELNEEVSEPFVASDGSVAEEPAGEFIAERPEICFRADWVYDAGGGKSICTNCFMQQSSSPEVPGNATDQKHRGQAEGRCFDSVNPENGAVSGEPGRVGLLAQDHLPALLAPVCVGPDFVGSRHVDLLGVRRRPGAASRFLPSRFNADGDAVDCADMPCTRSPARDVICGLVLLLESEPLFASIIGVSGSGKSLFLHGDELGASPTAANYLGVAFTDPDATVIRLLTSSRRRFFFQDDPDKPVQLHKTDVVGSHLYDHGIRLGSR